MPDDSYASVDLADYVRVVLRRKWLILSVLLLAILLAYAYSRTQTATYTTAAQLKFAEPSVSQSANPKVLQAYAQDEASFVRSVSVATDAAELVGTEVDPRTLIKNLRVAATESLVVNVRYTAKDPKVAQETAQAFAQAYINRRTADARAERDRVVKNNDTKIQALQKEVDRVTAELETACAAAAVAENPSLCSVTTKDFSDSSDELREARLAKDNIASLPIDAGEIFSPAPTPKAPSSPGLVRTLAFGAFIGLVLGLCIAFVRDRLDSRSRDRTEVAAGSGLVPLASIPMFDERHRSRPAALVTVHAPDSPEADAFRRLRASLLLAAREAGARVIAITSANAGEGKSTVSANLAVALAQVGNTVALVSTDIRRPSLERFFGLPSGTGLGDVLDGSVALDQALLLLTSSLAVLPSGNAQKGNPSDLLMGSSMTSVVGTLRGQFDYVIVDTPPVLAVADTLGMVPLFDAVVIVVSLDATTSLEVADAEDQLQRVGACVIGAVINRTAPKSQRYYAYQRRETVEK